MRGRQHTRVCHASTRQARSASVSRRGVGATAGRPPYAVFAHARAQGAGVDAEQGGRSASVAGPRPSPIRGAGPVLVIQAGRPEALRHQDARQRSDDGDRPRLHLEPCGIRRRGDLQRGATRAVRSGFRFLCQLLFKQKLETELRMTRYMNFAAALVALSMSTGTARPRSRPRRRPPRRARAPSSRKSSRTPYPTW